MTKDKLLPIKGGWAAVGQGWAVFGESKDEAISNFESAERKHREISKRISSAALNAAN